MNKIFDVDICHEFNIMNPIFTNLIEMALMLSGPSVDDKENNRALDKLPSLQESSQPSPGSPQKFPLYHTLFPYRKITTKS